MKIIKEQKGLTLIELMVSMGIFVIVITIAVGSFLSILKLQSQAEAMTDVQQNGRIVLEQMTRLARQAETLKIIDGEKDKIVFNDKMCFAVDGDGVLQRYNDYPVNNCTTNGFSITNSEVEVANFDFTKIAGNPPALKINILLKHNNIDVSKNDVLTLNTSVNLIGLR